MPVNPTHHTINDSRDRRTAYVFVQLYSSDTRTRGYVHNSYGVVLQLVHIAQHPRYYSLGVRLHRPLEQKARILAPTKGMFKRVAFDRS